MASRMNLLEALGGAVVSEVICKATLVEHLGVHVRVDLACLVAITEVGSHGRGDDGQRVAVQLVQQVHHQHGRQNVERVEAGLTHHPYHSVARDLRPVVVDDLPPSPTRVDGTSSTFILAGRVLSHASITSAVGRRVRMALPAVFLPRKEALLLFVRHSTQAAPPRGSLDKNSKSSGISLAR